MSAVQIVALERNGRLMEAAAVVLSATPDTELLTTNLNKALFYFDLYCLRDLGHVVTQNAFIALREGPVVAKYDQRLIDPLRKNGIAEQVERGSARPVKLLKAPDVFQFIGAEEIAIARNIVPQFARMSAREISDFSHNNPGWTMSYEQGLKSGHNALPIDLNIALQQIIDDDPWMNEPISPSLQRSFAAADHGEGDIW